MPAYDEDDGLSDAEAAARPKIVLPAVPAVIAKEVKAVAIRAVAVAIVLAIAIGAGAVSSARCVRRSPLDESPPAAANQER